ncbi:MAG: hypothetical protein JSS49_23910 [Planctomycetes bacterium]|nr:hypothetical protein [Planctomycetota bacterium]
MRPAPVSIRASDMVPVPGIPLRIPTNSIRHATCRYKTVCIPIRNPIERLLLVW